jgi:DNA-binding CsgD family transcriptional regulator
MPRLPPLTDDAWRAVVPALTGRDRELLAHLTAGHSVRLMAADMGISTNTVRTRVRRLTRKLGGVPADDGGPWVAVAAALAGRDEELLALLVDGRSTSGVAAAMGLSTNTVRTRVRRLTRKMDTAIAALDGHAAPPPPRVGVPPLSDALLSRPRLLELLSRAVQTGPVTLLAARIGSGKTVLAHCWVEAAPPGVYLAWLTSATATATATRSPTGRTSRRP